MRNAYLDTLYELAQEDKNVYAMISDNGAIVYDKFRQDLPKQYLNAGISEANMLGMAAGMASNGKIPFAYTIGAFLAYRAYEFIRNDICMQNRNVKIVGTGAGMVYSALGPTHHATEDMGGLRALPNLIIITPASPWEVKKAVLAAYRYQGPVYLRLGTNNENEIYKTDYSFEIGKGIVLQEGSDITLIGTGSMVKDLIDVAKVLSEDGISVRIINMHTVKPIDKNIIIDSMKNTKAIITVEDHNVIGGLGSSVSEIIAESGQGIKFVRLGLLDYSKGYGSYQEVKEANKIGRKNIIESAKKILL